jgi:hypothetical protein
MWGYQAHLPTALAGIFCGTDDGAAAVSCRNQQCAVGLGGGVPPHRRLAGR